MIFLFINIEVMKYNYSLGKSYAEKIEVCNFGQTGSTLKKK